MLKKEYLSDIYLYCPNCFNLIIPMFTLGECLWCRQEYEVYRGLDNCIKVKKCSGHKRASK